jgi:hypothetical protein
MRMSSSFTPAPLSEVQLIQMKRFRDLDQRAGIDDLELICLDPVDCRVVDTCLRGKVSEGHAKLETLLFDDMAQRIVMIYSHLTLPLSSNP